MSASTMSVLGFSTPEMDDIFSSSSLLAAMLEFEAALARALADTGIAPMDQALAVVEACSSPLGDPVSVLATTWDSGTPVIALLDQVGERLPDDEERRWLHHGSTTQDVVDTAHMLLARRGLESLEATLGRVAGRLRQLVEATRGMPQMGRTFLQQARPTTFSSRAAGWLDSALHHLVELRRRRTVLPVQLGGPVGNLGAYGDRGTDVVEAAARHLGLSAPRIGWHTDRTPIWELAATVAHAAATLAKAATDVALLAQSEVGEVEVRPGGSSSMGHKRNPVDSVRALAAYEVCRGAASMITGAKPHELDRAVGSWHAEWAALPLLFRSASACFAAAESMFAGLDADEAAMRGHLGGETGESPDETGRRQVDMVLEEFDRVMEER